jgi:zinc transporter 1/2/3
MFQNQCLGELEYEATATSIMMAGIFLSFLVEYAGNRLIQWHEAKARSVNIEAAAQAAAPKADMVNITVLEAGIIFHSLRKLTSPTNSQFQMNHKQARY